MLVYRIYSFYICIMTAAVISRFTINHHEQVNALLKFITMRSNYFLLALMVLLLLSCQQEKNKQRAANGRLTTTAKKKVAICCGSNIPSRFPAAAFNTPQNGSRPFNDHVKKN